MKRLVVLIIEDDIFDGATVPSNIVPGVVPGEYIDVGNGRTWRFVGKVLSVYSSAYEKPSKELTDSYVLSGA